MVDLFDFASLSNEISVECESRYSHKLNTEGLVFQQKGLRQEVIDLFSYYSYAFKFSEGAICKLMKIINVCEADMSLMENLGFD